jgi:hypothetical protein
VLPSVVLRWGIKIGLRNEKLIGASAPKSPEKKKGGGSEAGRRKDSSSHLGLL